MPPPLTRWATLATRQPPGFLPRSGGTALPLPIGKGGSRDGFILFGGYTEEVNSGGGPPLRAPTGEAWTVRLADSKNNAAASVLSPAPAGPPPRLAAAGATVGSTSWLIGGWDPGTKGDGGVILSDVWSFNGEHGWSPHPGAALPAPASRHCAAAVDGTTTIIICTHRCGETVLALDVANPAAPVLASLPCAPDPSAGYPPSRGLASLVSMPGTHTLLLFGGAPRRGGMDADLWRLTVEGGGGRWERVGGGEEGGGSAAWPPPRCSHVAAAFPGGGMLVWGGSYYGASGGLVARGDAWWWDEGDGAWTELRPGGDPPPAPRNAAAAAVVVEGSNEEVGVLIAGGWDPFRETYGDVAVLWVDEQNRTRVK